MNIRWLLPEHNRDPEAKKAFVFALQNSSVLTNRFLQILDDMEQSLYKFEGDIENYSEGWAMKQSFLNGRRAQLREIRQLFNFG